MKAKHRNALCSALARVRPDARVDPAGYRQWQKDCAIVLTVVARYANKDWEFTPEIEARCVGLLNGDGAPNGG